MTRQQSSNIPHVALLATGDEICNGDILNSNSQEMAHRLFSNGIHVGTHMAVADNLADLVDAMRYLLQHHQALIITGGLGPTSDDLTRQALSQVLNRQLIFDEPTWQAIVARLQHFGYDRPPENNKQQALFPEDTTIIPNPNGTAAGCMARHILPEKNLEQFIFMLPGPPHECLPLFESFVLPTLKSNHFQQLKYYDKWLLFGVSEGEIAERLDKLAEDFECITGYRFWYPYIEFKLYSNNQADFTALVPHIKNAIVPYLIGDGKLTASELLKTQISTLNISLTICDFATGGLLESILKTPETNGYIKFTSNLQEPTTKLQVNIAGLIEFWNNLTTSTQTALEICFIYDNKQENMRPSIPFRGSRVKQYAVEFICWRILLFLNKIKRL